MKPGPRSPMPETPPDGVIAVEFRDPKPKFTQADVDRIVGERLARDREAQARRLTPEERAATYTGSGLTVRQYSDASVTHEPRVYDLRSPHSFFADTWLAQQPSAQEHRGAMERRGQYARELAHEMARGSVEGRHAERQISARLRTLNAGEHEQRASHAISEVRALTTGGGNLASASGGGAAAFVSPFFLLEQWAPFRGIDRSFADQCHKVPLPPYGLQIYLPIMSSATKAGKQTEAGAVTEAVPSTALESAKVETVTGQLVITQQIFDRAFTGGGSMDVVIHQQIQQQLDQEVDVYVLAQALATAELVAGSTEYKTANLYKDLALAREKLTDIAGTRLRPTHLFTTADLYSYATRQVDATTERPIMTPTAMPGFPLTTGADAFDGEPKPKWARFTGTVLPGAVLWFTDDNIPVRGTGERTQLIIAAPETAIVLMEAEPVLSAFVETKAEELKVVLNLREYCAAITRHAAGTASISGGAYTTSLL